MRLISHLCRFCVPFSNFLLCSFHLMIYLLFTCWFLYWYIEFDALNIKYYTYANTWCIDTIIWYIDKHVVWYNWNNNKTKWGSFCTFYLLDDSYSFFVRLLWFWALLDIFFFPSPFSNIETFIVTTCTFFSLGWIRT
jgi:hypothetical protein